MDFTFLISIHLIALKAIKPIGTYLTVEYTWCPQNNVYSKTCFKRNLHYLYNYTYKILVGLIVLTI